MLKKIIVNSNQIASGLLNHVYPRLFIRPSTTFVSRLNKKDMIVVEIGVDRGYNAKSLLENLDIKMLYCVDPYAEPKYPKFSMARTGSDEAFKQAKKELRKFKDKVTFIRKSSLYAADEVPDELDFVYIDGLHNYDMVNQELKIYYLKLKKGGVIAGHDYFGDFIGVTEAVIEFKHRTKKKLYAKDVDWWFIK
jgi:hypothetical protein